MIMELKLEPDILGHFNKKKFSNEILVKHDSYIYKNSNNFIT